MYPHRLADGSELVRPGCASFNINGHTVRVGYRGSGTESCHATRRNEWKADRFFFLCRLFVSSTYTPLPVWVWESIYLFSIINTVLFFTSTKVLSSFTVHDSHTFETIKYNVVVVSKEREYWTYRWRRVRHRARGCRRVCRRVFIEQNEQQQTKRKTLSFPDLGGATVSSSLLWQSNNP